MSPYLFCPTAHQALFASLQSGKLLIQAFGFDLQCEFSKFLPVSRVEGDVCGITFEFSNLLAISPVWLFRRVFGAQTSQQKA